MIQEIESEGYKAFSDSLEVSLRPITVFFGKNNSGKTTLARLPILIAASLSNSDSFYTLSSHGITFGSSFTDLASVNNPHPAISFGIEWSPERRLFVQLQHVVSPEEGGSVQLNLIEIDRHQTRLPLRSQPTGTPREQINRMLSADIRRRLDKYTEDLREVLDSLVHIPSSRPNIQPLYDARDDVAWTVDEVPYLLQARRGLLNAVDDWFNKHLDGSGIDIDQAAFAFRLVESRAGQNVNFTQSGRGVQSALPVVTLLLAVARDIRKSHLVIIEEPEAHLHPSVHGDMADLVIECASKSQVIVETHSENFLLRLRRRVAEGKLSHRNIALHYVDDSHQVSQVSIDRFGGTTEWPLGVFESDIEEARAIVEAKISAINSAE